MSAILRWFDWSGERHRVYFQYSDDEKTRHLVVGGRGWQSAVQDVEADRLEDLSDEVLFDLVRRFRPGPASGMDLALGAD